MRTDKDLNPNLSRTDTRRPNWWNEQHTSGWDRVKEAFRRDWEQTKNDLSGQKSGRDLNQDVGDTLSQMTGKEGIPPINQQNIPDDPKEAQKRLEKLSKTTEKANERIAKAQGEIVEARQDMNADIRDAKMDLQEKRQDAFQDISTARDPYKEQNKASEKLARAEAKVADKIDHAREKAGSEVMKERERIATAQMQQQQALKDWSEVENAMRYGYGVRSQYPTAAWDDNLETKLRTEWGTMGESRSYDESRDYIRRGWNLAGKH